MKLDRRQFGMIGLSAVLFRCSKVEDEYYEITADSEFVHVDVMGDGTDLIRVPTFCAKDKSREHKKFMAMIKDEKLNPCRVWIIDCPKGQVAMAAVSKSLYPNAKLVQTEIVPAKAVWLWPSRSVNGKMT